MLKRPRLYDSLIITNIPAFYKINLWNEVAKKSKIFVICISSGSKIRTTDFTQGEMGFEHVFLSSGDFESFSLTRIAKLTKLIFSIPHKNIVICGWDMLEYWLCALLSPKSKNVVLIESSEHEGAKSGIRFWLKKGFVARISKALVSGVSQEKLMRNLGFGGECEHTGGVGIFHKPKVARLERKFRGKFLFVGRLSHEKNIEFLLGIFRELPMHTLTIAGTGIDSDRLKSSASENVRFLGHVPNDEISTLYDVHDMLLLPSLVEPWGLVVEEAVYHGMPVIVSDKVGCATEIVVEPKTGYVLAIDKKIWEDVMTGLDNNGSYTELVTNCYDFDFESRDNRQVEAFI